MKLEQLIDQFELITDVEEGFEQLRTIILDLAVRGKLTKQNQKDVSASTLLRTIKRKREELYQQGEIRKQGDLPKITENEVPYELPQNWSWERLGNVGIVNPRINAEEDLEASFVPMKLISEDYSGRHEFEVRMWGDIRKGYTHFGENDVGMAKITPCFENGKAAIFRNLKNGIGAGTTELYVFRVIPETILPEYVYSFVQSPRFKSLGKATMTGTAGQQRVPRSYFEEALFPLPPFEEQQRIVQKIETLFYQIDELEQKVQQDEEVDERLQGAVLDDLQRVETPEASRRSWQRLTDHFEQIYRKPEHIDQLKQAILNEAVRGRLVPQDPNDEPAEMLLERIKEEKLRLYEEGEIRKPKDIDPITEEETPYELPEGWIWARVGDIAKVVEYGTSQKSHKEPNGVPMLRMGNINEFGNIALNNLKYVDEEIDDLPRLYLKDKDLLFNRTNSYELVGKMGLYHGEDDKYTFASYLIRVQLFHDLISVEYVHNFINSENCRKVEIEPEITQQTNQANFNGTKLQHIRVPLPPLEEQKRIMDAINHLFAWCDDLKEKLSRSQQTDQRLLEALVNDVA